MSAPASPVPSLFQIEPATPGTQTPAESIDLLPNWGEEYVFPESDDDYTQNEWGTYPSHQEQLKKKATRIDILIWITFHWSFLFYSQGVIISIIFRHPLLALGLIIDWALYLIINWNKPFDKAYLDWFPLWQRLEVRHYFYPDFFWEFSEFTTLSDPIPKSITWETRYTQNPITDPWEETKYWLILYKFTFRDFFTQGLYYDCVDRIPGPPDNSFGVFIYWFDLELFSNILIDDLLSQVDYES